MTAMFSGCVNLSRCPVSIYLLWRRTKKANVPLKIPGQCALSGTEAETEGDIETWVDGLTEGVATRTAHIALEQTTKGAVYDTVAFKKRGAARASVCSVQ